jgi:hypothetical protein
MRTSLEKGARDKMKTKNAKSTLKRLVGEVDLVLPVIQKLHLQVRQTTKLHWIKTNGKIKCNKQHRRFG